MLFTYFNFKFSNPFNFIVISAYSSLSTGFWKSLSSSRIEDGCDALFFAIFCGVDVRVIIKPFVIFIFLCSCLFREYAFLTMLSILTAS